MKSGAPVDIFSSREFYEVYDRRLLQQQLARATFYHLWLQFDQDESSAVRSIVEVPAQFEILNPLTGDSTALRLTFLNNDLRPVGFSQDTWGEMVDGDVYLERPLLLDANAGIRLRTGILLPFDDEVGRVPYAGFSIADMVNRVLKKRPRHRREDMNGQYD